MADDTMADADLADELRFFAQQVGTLEVTGKDQEIGAHLALVLYDAADRLEVASTPAAPPAPALCGRKGCDRPMGHKPYHSWEAAVYRQRLVDYEVDAAKVPVMRSQMADLQSKMKRSEQALTEANRHFWQRRDRQALKVADRG